MIQKFVDTFISKQKELRENLRQNQPESYCDLVKMVVEILQNGGDDYSDDYSMDPERIHQIDDGDYQGTLLFVIGAKGYQPSQYWYVLISYGSCSGCDTLEDIQSKGDYNYEDNSLAPARPDQVSDYMTLALHIVQGLHALDHDAV